MKLFITGTDTGVGKTWVSAALAAQALDLGKSVIYYKPIQTGSPVGQPPEDPQCIHDLLGDQVKTYCRYCFEPPVTPSVADTKGIIQTSRILEDVDAYGRQADLLLVEGAGGLAVPISDSLLMIDLIQQLAIPVLLVAHCRLGTINHTLLSVEALQRRNIPIQGIVLNFYPPDLQEAPYATQTLIPALKQHLSPDIPLWPCYASSSASPTHCDLPTSVSLLNLVGM